MHIKICQLYKQNKWSAYACNEDLDIEQNLTGYTPMTYTTDLKVNNFMNFNHVHTLFYCI